MQGCEGQSDWKVGYGDSFFPSFLVPRVLLTLTPLVGSGPSFSGPSPFTFFALPTEAAEASVYILFYPKHEPLMTYRFPELTRELMREHLVS